MPKHEGYFWLLEDDGPIIVYYHPSLEGYMICGESELQPYGYNDILIPIDEPEFS